MNTLNPKWGQRLLLYVRDIEKDMLKVGGEGPVCVWGEGERSGRQGLAGHVNPKRALSPLSTTPGPSV